MVSVLDEAAEEGVNCSTIVPMGVLVRTVTIAAKGWTPTGYLDGIPNGTDVNCTKFDSEGGGRLKYEHDGVDVGGGIRA